MKLLTVGLPVHNAMPFLPETVDSLLKQSYENFELLVIDDGSRDDSLAFLKSIKDRRLRLISQENRGLTATLNRMLAEVNTPWLVRHDADDIAFPHRLGLIAESIGRYPDAGMFYSYARYYQNGRFFGTFRTTSATPERLRDLTRAGYLLAICHPTVTLNVAKTIDLGGYRFNLHVEDIDLWWRMALEYDIQLIPAATVGFRHNSMSVSSSNFEKQCVNTLFIQYLLLSHLWQLRPLSYEEISPRLMSLVNRRHIRFRENARLANISLSGKSYASAMRHLGQAFVASPADMVKRILYEFRSGAPVVNGENWKRFQAQKDLMWPEQSDRQDASAPAITSASRI